MKIALIFISYMFLSVVVSAQLNLDDYYQFKSQNVNMSFNDLNDLFPRTTESYYKGYNNTPDFSQVNYLDSVTEKLELTASELELLTQNHFFVSERMNYSNFGTALHTIYANDLPVFISTDAVLHALHSSYSFMLKNIERSIMLKNLELYLKDLYDSFPALAEKYAKKGVDISIEDIDLYVAVAYSLISDSEQPVRYVSETKYDELMDAIGELSNAKISLFCKSERKRDIDFSQFKVRGHYVYTVNDKEMGFQSLEPYFRTMMWLGRIDFFLTAPIQNPWVEPWGKEEIRRMNISASLLNELSNNSSTKGLFETNEKIINYLVGESDNVVSSELTEYQVANGISDASQMLDDQIYNDYYDGFSLNPDFEQKIMGGMLFVDPSATEPDVLPVSFKLSGQRFIIDSYVLANVVYDRIIFEGKKVFRGLPNPLDATFALGNNDAAYLLEDEIEEYKYAPNLANMRYLIDHKEDNFWQESLYNSWLGALRSLNPIYDDTSFPFFMRTSAWHHQKMNTQLASWSQLRHDNLLYAKPSYTGMAGCSYPYSYVEPYPEFYAALADFADDAGQFISTLTSNSWEFYSIQNYFPQFSEIMKKLEILALKELNNEEFSTDEERWLKSMLFESGGSGAPPYSGWYNQLYINPDDIIKNDFPIVDLHTQPTDENGNYVGHVLHAGTGKVNLGTFLIKTPGSDRYVAYTGPFFSYYEKITSDFLRLTDQDWGVLVDDEDLPPRPEWTNLYLADNDGNRKAAGIELPSEYLVGVNDLEAKLNNVKVYPNPVNTMLNIDTRDIDLYYQIRVYDISGRLIKNETKAGSCQLNLSSYKKGLYLLKIQSKNTQTVYKIFKN